MSSSPNGPSTYPPRANGEGNTLGLIGFVLSLIGLLGCCVQPAALFSIAGLVLSIVALSKRPRGLAIAGVVLGVLGASSALVVFLLIGAAVLAFIPLAIAVAAMAGPEIETEVEQAILEAKVSAYVDQAGAFPTDLSQIPDLSEKLLTDPWGTPYRLDILNVAAEDFEIRSAGPDRVFDTEDDVTSD